MGKLCEKTQRFIQKGTGKQKEHRYLAVICLLHENRFIVGV